MNIVDVIITSDTTVTVKWDPPIQPNGIITGYEVKYSVYENTSDIISVPVSSNINSLNMTNLGKQQYGNIHGYS